MEIRGSGAGIQLKITYLKATLNYTTFITFKDLTQVELFRKNIKSLNYIISSNFE